MNFKEKDNILLIICGAMGVAAFALIFRYLFIEWGFDNFGANAVFIIIFVIGVVVFISYLEFIQKVIPKFFKKRQEVIDENTEYEAPIIEEVRLDLDSIREKHKLDEQQRREKLLEDAIEYTQTIFAPYATDENINRLCDYIADYYNGIKFGKDIQPVIVKDLSNGDIFHFGWNIWNRFKSVRNCKQDEIAYFLKAVFSKQLKDVDVNTIKKKLAFDEGKFKIKIEKQLP